MTFSDDSIAGWYYLSCLPSEDAFSAFEELQSKIQYIPEDYQPLYTWYLDYYKSYESFPTWEQFKSVSQMENDCVLNLTEARHIYSKVLTVWETDSLSKRMSTLPLAERKPLLDRLVQLMQTSVDVEKQVLSTGSFSLEDTIILTEKKEEQQFKFPIKRLNDVCHIKPGNTISVLAPPGMFKTGFMQNCCYVNSVKGSLRSLYIYLENLPQAYMADQYSRFSFENEPKVENSVLKQGVSAEDEAAVKVVLDLKQRFDDYKKGEIYYKPFTDYPTDPIKFGNALAADVNRLNIDIIYFDYLQRTKVFAPLRVDGMSYINQIMSTITQVALGGCGAKHPSIAFVGVQPNRDAQTKAERTKGSSLGLPSIAECSSVERDSFVVIALYADAESKNAGQLNYKVCKNRDGEVDISMMTCPVMPQYAYLGDLSEGTDTNIYSNDLLDDLFDL